MSELMFVRDGRTLPFIPVTVAALNAMRATCEQPRNSGQRRSYPHALAVYMALLQLANDRRTDRAAITHNDLGERSQTSRATAQRALVDLQDAGLVVSRAQTHSTSRIENEYIVVEPNQQPTTTPAKETAPPHQTDATPASDRCSTRARVPSLPLEAQGVNEEQKKTTKKRARSSSEVFAEWVSSTGRDQSRTQLTVQRERVIDKAINCHGLDDCLRAVRNIGRCQDARTGYGRGTRFDDIKHALGDAERLERWRDYQPVTVTRPTSKPRMANAGNLDRFNDSDW